MELHWHDHPGSKVIKMENKIMTLQRHIYFKVLIARISLLESYPSNALIKVKRGSKAVIITSKKYENPVILSFSSQLRVPDISSSSACRRGVT
jgi:hypothetical protein